MAYAYASRSRPAAAPPRSAGNAKSAPGANRRNPRAFRHSVGEPNTLLMASLPPILLLDDDPDDLIILRRLLSKAGVKNKTVAFEDSSAAVAHLEAEIARGHQIYYPCLAITDLHMPRMNGFAFTEWVRAQPALADTMVIMVSSSEDPKDKARALKAGARHFFLKYPPASVLEKIVREAKCG